MRDSGVFHGKTATEETAKKILSPSVATAAQKKKTRPSVRCPRYFQV